MHTFLGNKGNAPCEDIHEVGEIIRVRAEIELLDVQGVTLQPHTRALTHTCMRIAGGSVRPHIGALTSLQVLIHPNAASMCACRHYSKAHEETSLSIDKRARAYSHQI